MTQPLQHQTPRCARVLVVERSAFFTPGRPYAVIRWNDSGDPWVVNDAGSKTWLLHRHQWAPFPEPMTLARSQELLHANWLAQCAAREHG